MTITCMRSFHRAVAPAAVCAGLLLALAPALAAQGVRRDTAARASVVGTVRATGGAPVAGAEVQVGPQFRTTTDSAGAFELHGLPVGVVDIEVRHLGFAPLITEWELGPDTMTLNLQMRENPTQLPAVQVKSDREPYQSRLDGFYRRMKQGNGHYLTRSELDRYPGRTLTEMLARFPGVTRYQLPGAGEGIHIAGQSCVPLVVIDGFPATSGTLANRGFDLDMFDPVGVEGVEIYRSGLTAPPELMGAYGQGSCGMIAVWSRPMRPNVRASQLPPEGAVNIDSLLRAKTVYTMGAVDVPAVYVTGTAQPKYPDSLYRARVSGEVLARFVVDTAGRVEKGSVEIVSSTHEQFSNSVRVALERARFAPAVVGGRPVREVVKMPFEFRPSADSAGGSDGGGGGLPGRGTTPTL